MNDNQVPSTLDLSKTTSLETWSGDKIWQSGYILRTVSKFVSGTDTDQVIPIQVFFDPRTGRILDNMLPPEIRSEYMEKVISEDLSTSPSEQEESNIQWDSESEDNTSDKDNNTPPLDQSDNDSSIPIWGQF